MSGEEFFNRAINRICKDYGYDFATEFKNIYLKKDKELQQKENIIKKAREYIEEHTTYERYGYIDEMQLIDLDFSIKDLKQILDKDITKKSDCNYGKVEKENK